MEFTTFVRKPFKIEAIEITEENIDELAELIGTIRHDGSMNVFIQVDPNLVPHISRVYPGFWMTRMREGGKIQCYSKKTFEQQFAAETEEIRTWVDFMNGPSRP